MSLKDLARRLYRKSIHARPVRPIRNLLREHIEQLEGRDNPSNLNLSASVMPSTITLGSSALVSGSVSASEPMSSLSLTYIWGDSNSTSDPHTFLPATTGCLLASQHNYLAAGTYSITVTASASYEGGGSDSSQVTYSVVVNPVSPPPPPVSPPPISPPPSPPALPDVRVDAIFDTSEDASAPVGQFDLVRVGGDLTQTLSISTASLARRPAGWTTRD